MKKDTPEIEGFGHLQSEIISEERRSAVVLSFGRMNPPTSGHQKLVDKLQSVARIKKATPELYLSHSQDKKKNPLTYDEKLRYTSKAFGKIVKKSKSKTIMQVLAELDRKYTDAYIVVGGDRVDEFRNLVTKYNNKDYNFKTLEVISAGERDPDADDVSGMSASKLRALAAEGKYKEYRSGLPRKMSERDAKEMYEKIRSALGINEDMSLQEVLNLQQRLKRKALMRRIKGRIARGRRIARRKIASPEKIKVRSNRKARNIIRGRLAGERGKNYKDLPAAAKIAIDKRLASKKKLISQIARRIRPQVKKADMERLRKFRINKTKREDIEWINKIGVMINELENSTFSTRIEKNLEKKSQKYGVSVREIKEKYLQYKAGYTEVDTDIEEEKWVFNALNSELANQQKNEINEALDYHINNNISLVDNVFRVGSINYYKLFSEAKKLYYAGEYIPPTGFDREIIEGDIGDFGLYEGEYVPLDCPMEEVFQEEEKKDVELNKPKKGGPKKFYVYVKDPSTGNIKKVTWGDTTGLKVKINDPEARKSFAARHKCSTQNDKTSAAYWACRLPKYASQLGLSGGGNFFW